MTKNCLIFDSDGTLVDSELLNCQALSAMLAKRGLDLSAEYLLASYRGWMFAAELDDLCHQYGVELGDDFVDQFRTLAVDYFKRGLKPIPNIATALRTLSQLHPEQQPDTRHMCVASNGPSEKMALALGLTGLDRFFGERVFSAYDVGSWKPEPGLFLHAAESLGYAAQDCIVIEDSAVGIAAATKAAMRAVFYDPHELPVTLAGNVKVIRDMADLPDAITGTW